MGTHLCLRPVAVQPSSRHRLHPQRRPQIWVVAGTSRGQARRRSGSPRAARRSTLRSRGSSPQVGSGCAGPPCARSSVLGALRGASATVPHARLPLPAAGPPRATSSPATSSCRSSGPSWCRTASSPVRRRSLSLDPPRQSARTGTGGRARSVSAGAGGVGVLRATAAARAMDEQAKAAAGGAGHGGRGRHRRPCRPRRVRVVSAGEQAKARAGAGGVVHYEQDPGLIRRRALRTSRSRELPDGSRIAGGRSRRG